MYAGDGGSLAGALGSSDEGTEDEGGGHLEASQGEVAAAAARRRSASGRLRAAVEGLSGSRSRDRGLPRSWRTRVGEALPPPAPRDALEDDEPLMYAPLVGLLGSVGAALGSAFGAEAPGPSEQSLARSRLPSATTAAAAAAAPRRRRDEGFRWEQGPGTVL